MAWGRGRVHWVAVRKVIAVHTGGGGQVGMASWVRLRVPMWSGGLTIEVTTPYTTHIGYNTIATGCSRAERGWVQDHRTYTGIAATAASCLAQALSHSSNPLFVAQGS